MVKSKEFTNYDEAKAFAVQHKGYIEGAFIDEKLNRSYIVFYKDSNKKNDNKLT